MKAANPLEPRPLEPSPLGPSPLGPSPLEHRLLWLAVSLKLLFWAAVAATLIVGIRDASTGRNASMPMALIGTIAVLAGLQLCAWLAWALLRRARMKRGGS